MSRNRSMGQRGRELLCPSLLLLPILAMYWHYGAVEHFFLHTLMGWDVALLGLLAATYWRWPRLRYDGCALLGLALYAMIPDFVYAAGPAHRDWMDVFLFHIALDEILPVAVPVLVLLWLVLLGGYLRFRRSEYAHDDPSGADRTGNPTPSLKGDPRGGCQQ